MFSFQANKKTTKNHALEKMDDFYGSVFGNRWKSIRIALLSENKYVSMINNFGDRERTCASLEAAGAINIKDLVALEKENLRTENNDLINEKTTYKMDNVISGFIKEQESRELKSIYPESEVEEREGQHLEARRIVNVEEGTDFSMSKL